MPNTNREQEQLEEQQGDRALGFTALGRERQQVKSAWPHNIPYRNQATRPTSSLSDHKVKIAEPESLAQLPGVSAPHRYIWDGKEEGPKYLGPCHPSGGSDGVPAPAFGLDHLDHHPVASYWEKGREKEMGGGISHPSHICPQVTCSLDFSLPDTCNLSSAQVAFLKT